MIRALALAAAAVIFLAGCGGGSSPSPQTPVQKCTAAFQAYVDAGLNGMSAARIRAYGSAKDVAILNAAQSACDALTPAQAKQAGADVTP